MKVVGYIAVFIGGLVSCYLLVSLGVLDAFDGIPGTQTEPSLSLPTYLSFVGVMMTAVTTVLAAVAIGIGVIAAYTFREIKDEARTVATAVSSEKAVEVAQNVSKQVADEALSEVKVKKFVEEIYAASMTQTTAESELRPGFDLDNDQAMGDDG